MSAAMMQTCEARMDKSIDALKADLSKVRTGRAQPDLLSHLMVSYYGQPTALPQVASISVLDARTLSVTPWEKAIVGDVEKAIMESGLGLNPTVAGQVIRVPLPALTEARRKELTKVVFAAGESTRVAIRNIRRDVLSDVKQDVKDKVLTEDDEHRLQQQVQALTDRKIADVDALLKAKEAELMQV